MFCTKYRPRLRNIHKTGYTLSTGRRTSWGALADFLKITETTDEEPCLEYCIFQTCRTHGRRGSYSGIRMHFKCLILWSNRERACSSLAVVVSISSEIRYRPAWLGRTLRASCCGFSFPKNLHFKETTILTQATSIQILLPHYGSDPVLSSYGGCEGNLGNLRKHSPTALGSFAGSTSVPVA